MPFFVELRILSGRNLVGEYSMILTILKKKNFKIDLIFKKSYISGDIFRTVAFHGKEFFYPVAVITLKFNRISFHGPAAGEFSFHEL